MKRWLLNYLDEYFRETSRQIEGLRAENVQQHASLREELTRRIADLRSELLQRLERLDANFRHTRFELEKLSDDHDVVAGEVSYLKEKLADSSERFRKQLETVQDSVSSLRGSISSLETPKAREVMEGVRQVIAKYQDRPSS